MPLKSRPSQLKANKVYYEKNKETICKNAAANYKENAENIKAKRRARYKRQKEERLKQLQDNERCSGCNYR